MHHYPFHPGDYMLDTAHLEPLEDLAYRRLIDFYYISEAAIPLETDLVSRRLRLGSEVVSKVLNEFFERRETGWHQARCDAEIADYKARADRARQNGKGGGRPKKQGKKPSRNPAGSQQEPSGNPEETGSKANQEPVTKNHISKESPAASELVLPFESIHFADAWGRWKRHRSEIRKPLKPTMEGEQLAYLAGLGEARAIACINHTIRKGWQGLREEESQTFTHHANTRYTPPRSDSANQPGRYA